MNKIDSAQRRESNNYYDESNMESYETYGKKSLPEEKKPHKENGKADVTVYDRYDSDYEGAETREGANLGSKKSCCKKGRLFNLKKSNLLYGAEFHAQIFLTAKAFFKDSHWPKVTNIVRL